jgi:CopG family nickel-responsive transcriptional regulator
MRTPLTRFGVAIETPLLAELDALVDQRGCTRSELLRDLTRSEVARAKIARGVESVAALTIIYDHHVPALTERLNELQHELGEQVRASLHVHLTHHLCLEVIVLRGRSDTLQRLAEKILATRGVKQGGIEIFTGTADIADHDRDHDHRHHPAPHTPSARKRARKTKR